MQHSRDIGLTLWAPFGTELPLGDLLQMAFVELREAKERITISRELMGIERPTLRAARPCPAISSEDLVLI